MVGLGDNPSLVTTTRSPNGKIAQLRCHQRHREKHLPWCVVILTGQGDFAPSHCRIEHPVIAASNLCDGVKDDANVAGDRESFGYGEACLDDWFTGERRW